MNMMDLGLPKLGAQTVNNAKKPASVQRTDAGFFSIRNQN